MDAESIVAGGAFIKGHWQVKELAEAIARETDPDKRRLATVQGVWAIPSDVKVRSYVGALREAFARHGLPPPVTDQPVTDLSPATRAEPC